MGVRGQEGVEVGDRQGAGLPVDVHPLVDHRWVAPAATVGPCQAIAVPMVVVRLIRKVVVTAAVFAIDERRGMRAGIVRGVATDLATDSEIDLESDTAIDPVIAPESDSGIDPVPSTGIRMLFVRNLRTTVQGPDDFGIGMIVTATAVAPGMNGASRPSAPDRATTMAVPSDWMQHRRPQRPHLRQMI